jgi:hypothetical protein
MIKKLIRICANTKSAFTRLERFADNYVVDPKPEQLEVRLKLFNENWEKYNNVQDGITTWEPASFPTTTLFRGSQWKDFREI